MPTVPVVSRGSSPKIKPIWDWSTHVTQEVWDGLLSSDHLPRWSDLIWWVFFRDGQMRGWPPKIGSHALMPPTRRGKSELRAWNDPFRVSFTLRDFWRIPMGKPLVGSVVNHSRKSGWGFVILSTAFSRSISHFTKRWQFCNMSHCPRATAFSSSWRATWEENEMGAWGVFRIWARRDLQPKGCGSMQRSTWKEGKWEDAGFNLWTS